MKPNRMLSGTRCVFLSLLVLAGILNMPQTKAQSLLWKITGNDLTVPSYVYGTIHLTDARVFEWKDAVYSYLEQCDAFGAEIDLSMENLMKATTLMLLPEGQTLHDRFTADEYDLVQTAVKNCSGFELSLFNKIKPPALISLCLNNRKDGDMEATVDELLYNYAKTKGLVTFGIETIEEQMAMLDKIPDQYVLEYFRNMDEQEKEFEDLIRCYRKADLDSIWILIQEEESGALLNDELIRIRNYHMAERIIPQMKQQSTFIAVGAGHLPGGEGIIALLRKEGYTVEPEVIR